jgi:IPT/TIG domain
MSRKSRYRVSDEDMRQRNNRVRVMREEDIGWWGEITRTRRRMIFFYDLLWLVILGLIGIYLAGAYGCKPEKVTTSSCVLALVKSCWPLLTEYKLFINCMWMGALGGVTISLKGVYDHGNPNDPWSNGYNLWHIGRPFSGAVAGAIAGLLFALVFPLDGKVSHLVLYGVAFIFGTQDAAFFSFLSEFASRFVKTTKPGPTGVRINAVTPPHGTAGDVVTIVGQGFEADATVKIGPVKIDKYTMTADGTTISGVMPAVAGLAAGDHSFDVIVMNPTGSSAAAVAKFTFAQPAPPPPPPPPPPAEHEPEPAATP